MTSETMRNSTEARRGFRVIDGDGAAVPAIPSVDAAHHVAEELAADMGTLLAFGLMNSAPLGALRDPHHQIAARPGARLTPADCIAELRSLPWFDASGLLSMIGVMDEASCLRQKAACNAQGQLSLPSLLSCGVAPGPDTESGFADAGLRGLARAGSPWSDDSAAVLAALPSNTLVNYGDALPLADLGEMATDRTIAQSLHRLAGEAFGDPANLPEGWSAQDALGLFSQTERSMIRLAREIAHRRDRLCRPAVMAARMSVCLSRQHRHDAPDGDLLETAGQQLLRYAPRLLDWVSHANEDTRRAAELEHALFLPLIDPQDAPPHPADRAASVLVGSALATLLQALLPVSPVTAEAARARQILQHAALSRLVSATHYPSENFREMALGEASALSFLHARLEEMNRDIDLAWTGIDGAGLRLRATACRWGRAQVAFLRNGQPASWNRPRMVTRRPPILAVV